VKITTNSPELTERRIGECVSAVLGTQHLRRATAYISPTLVIKASAQRRYRKNERSITMLVTVGKPNFAEQRFIRVCQRAGMCFPLKQIQLKFWPKKS
jgi:hypothetical protein